MMFIRITRFMSDIDVPLQQQGAQRDGAAGKAYAR
jgi:hypothetical protein